MTTETAGEPSPRRDHGTDALAWARARGSRTRRWRWQLAAVERPGCTPRKLHHEYCVAEPEDGHSGPVEWKRATMGDAEGPWGSPRTARVDSWLERFTSWVFRRRRSRQHARVSRTRRAAGVLPSCLAISLNGNPL